MIEIGDLQPKQKIKSKNQIYGGGITLLLLLHRTRDSTIFLINHIMSGANRRTVLKGMNIDQDFC